jgi:transcriptional regulator with XRE-family HTH domain
VQELSERLAALGRPILPSGLSKIEQGTRRVDVDDLVALADALETVPSRLLRSPDGSRAPIGLANEEIVDAAIAALRAAEDAGISRDDVAAWMDQIDRLKPLFERMARQFAKFTPVSEAAKAMATKMAPAFPEGMKAKFEEMAKRAHAEREDDGER